MKNEIQKAQGAEVTFVIPSAEEIGRLSSMSKKFKLTMDYKTADDWAKIKDQPLRCFYKGLKEIPNEKGEQVCCGIFVSETECFLSGQMALIEAVIGLPVNTPLEITYTGKKTNKSSVGSTMLFNVVTLGE